MGILKNIVENTKEEVEKDVTAVAAVGVLGFIGAAVETVGAAGNAVANSVEKAMEKHNLASLKKESRKDDYYLFVNKETKIGEGIYNITDKNKEQKYNTLIEGGYQRQFHHPFVFKRKRRNRKYRQEYCC